MSSLDKKAEEDIPDGVTNYKRPGWDEYFFEIMRAIAKRATCARGRSGCVIAKDKQLVSAGYVGSPIGEDHCDDVGHLYQKRYDEKGNYSLHCVRTVHAEQNAICQAAKRGISIEGATLYCQMTPCPVCAKMIINCGIVRVVCMKKYHDGAEAERLFLRAGVALEHIDEEEQEYDNKGSKHDSKEGDKTKEGKRLQTVLKVKKLSDKVKMPDYAYEGDAGLDLYSTEEIEVPSGSRVKVPTGIAIEVPSGYVGLIWDRGGTPVKKGLKVVGGVMDTGYRGEMLVGMANISKESVTIQEGEKIAQLLVQPIESVKVEEVQELSETERSESGFGSSDYPVNEVLEEIDYLPDGELEADEGYDEEINPIEEGDEIQSRW